MAGASKGTQRCGIERTYAGNTESVHHAREDLGQWLASMDLAPLTADAQLVLSELSSNAVEASPHLEYSVCVSVEDGRLRIAVSNSSTALLPAERDWKSPDPLASQGRGLSIVDALSESVEVEQTASIVTVSAHLRTEMP